MAAVTLGYAREIDGLSVSSHLKSRRQVWMVFLDSEPGADVAASPSAARERFGANLNMLLHAERAMHGRTAAQVADVVGVTPQIMSRWRAGKALPRAEQLDKLADAFGVDVEVFFRRSGLGPDATPHDMLQRLAEFYGARILWPKGDN